MLSQFSAPQAQSIHALISEYADNQVVPTSRYVKPRSYRLIAVATRDASLSEEEEETEMKRLRYRENEAIVIQSRLSEEIYVGVLHKVVGTFALSNMRLFQGKTVTVVLLYLHVTI